MLIQILIIFGVIIVALIFAFRMVFRRDLDSAMFRMKKFQEDAMLKESHLRDELERAKLERASQVEKGKKDARKIVEQAKKEAEAIRAEMKEQSLQEKEDILDAGEEALNKLKKNFTREVNDAAVKFAGEMIKETLTAKGKEHLQRALIGEFLEDLGKIEKDRFTVQSNRGVVSSSFSLTEEERGRLKQILLDKIGRKIEFEEQVDAALIAGLVIKIGEFVIDGSLRNKMQKAVVLLRKK